MKFILFVAMLTSGLIAADKVAADAAHGPRPNPVTRTFYIAGVTRREDVERISTAVAAVPSVTSARGLTTTSGYIIVSFDTHRILSHTVAQAIMNQGQFVVTQQFEILTHATHADALHTLFAKIAKERHVKIELTDSSKGRFTLTFLPIQVDAKDQQKTGFNPGHLGHPIRDAPPKGLGLKITNIEAPSVNLPAK